MTEENISQKFRLKNIDETRNYLIKEIKRNKMISKKHNMVCTSLNCIEHFLIFASGISGSISIFAFTSLAGTPIGITSSAIGRQLD